MQNYTKKLFHREHAFILHNTLQHNYHIGSYEITSLCLKQHNVWFAVYYLDIINFQITHDGCER